MTQEEFMEKFPKGSIISFIESMHYVRSNIRTLLRIDKYENKNGDWKMFGIECNFNFETSSNLKKEFSLTKDNPEKWQCIDTNKLYGTYVGSLCYSYNDVRMVNEDELKVFNYALKKLK